MNHSDFFIERRKKVGLSQSKISEILGYSSQSVSAWESGRSFPDLSIWSKYASILGVDLEGFIFAKEQKNNVRCDSIKFDSDKFSKYLKYLRKKNNLILSDLSKLIGVNVKTISAWEKAKSYPNLQTYIKLCNLYMLTMDELYFVIQDKKSDVVTKPIRKKRIFLPIILPIIITIGVGGGTTTAVVVTYHQRMASSSSSTTEPNYYQVTWKNYDGTTLKIDENILEGTLPFYSGANPTRANDSQYSYTFNGWLPEIKEVSGNVTYTATYKNTINSYTIKWQNYDGSLLLEETYDYGQTPSYKGEEPKRASTLEVSYDFVGWTPEIQNVSDNQTYTASFKQNDTEYIGGDGNLKIDYMIDENGQDHIYDIKNPEGLSIVLNNNNDLKVKKVDLKVDNTSYEINEDKFIQNRDIVTIDKTFFSNIYTDYGYNSFVQLTKVTYINEDNLEDVAFTYNDYFEFGVVSSDDAVYVDSFLDFNKGGDYKYYLLNKDIDIPTDQMGLDVKGVIDGKGHTIGNVTLNKVDRIYGECNFAIFSTFRGIIYNLNIDNIDLKTNIVADNDTHIATLIGTGIDYTVSKVNVTNVSINVKGDVNPNYASLLVACSVNGAIDRVSISDSSLTINGNNSESYVSGFIARSSTSTNYSIRDSIMVRTKINLSSEVDWCTASYISNTFVFSIKRVIVFDSELECPNTHSTGYGGFIYEDGKEIEGAFFLKNDTKVTNPSYYGIITADNSTKINSCYYSSDNLTMVPKRNEKVDGTEIDSLSSLSTKDIYLNSGYRSLNWNMSNLGSGEDYKVPSLR